MKHKKAVKAVSLVLVAALGVGACSALAGCGSGEKALVIMTEELNGLFNPFYSTAGTDMDVVGQTQVSMFNTDSDGEISYGDDEPVVVKDFKQEPTADGNFTDYTFVLKNGIEFSDGKPLTMNDVMFNLYVYLDPVYTGSSTMYSTDIVGLKAYRTQTTNENDDEELTSNATGYAMTRREELLTAYDECNRELNPDTPDSYDVDIEKLEKFIKDEYTPTEGYRLTIWADGKPSDKDLANGTADELARAQLYADLEEALRLFREELNNDFDSAKDAYQEPPYVPQAGKEGQNDSDIRFDGDTKEVVSFMYMEGYITLAYADVTQNGTLKEDANHIVAKNDRTNKQSKKNYDEDAIEHAANPREAAIDFVYKNKVESAFNEVLRWWATGSNLLAGFIGKAKEVILEQNVSANGGQVRFPNISGIQSLGHTTNEQNVTIGEKTYKIAHDYNDDGTVKNAGEYAVLRIRINKIDPKAIWNFGFTVAPHHYYSDPEKYPVNIKENKFGVERGSYEFQTGVLQGNTKSGVSKNKVPLGAGPYVATDRDGKDNPAANEFMLNNIVYFKANEKFFANVEDCAESLHPPLIKRMNYQVVSPTNAIYQLRSGSVHFVEPQYTNENSDQLNDMKSSGFESVATWQLGYGYIGINAGKVPNIYIRRAIMSAMDTRLAINYYRGGEAVTIRWPMSVVSWAYPRTAGNSLDPADPLKNMEQNNGTEHDYTRYVSDESAKANILKYMALANVGPNSPDLKIQFTIAGSNLTDHPCYNVMKNAEALLDSCGWDVEVVSDVQALTKLSTGSLSVWAAAWGSTIDPDMYQVYHKNSTATSVYAWGYREILGARDSYPTEIGILDKLSTVIEQARETNERNGDNGRIALYKQAMSYVLDLAVELPVYQRKTLYAYNANVIDKNTLPEEINSYTSPLSRIWEVDFVK